MGHETCLVDASTSLVILRQQAPDLGMGLLAVPSAKDVAVARVNGCCPDV